MYTFILQHYTVELYHQLISNLNAKKEVEKKKTQKQFEFYIFIGLLCFGH